MSKMLKQRNLHYLTWFSMINDIFSMVKVDLSWYSLNYTFNFLLLIKESEQKMSLMEKVNRFFFLLSFEFKPIVVLTGAIGLLKRRRA